MVLWNALEDLRRRENRAARLRRGEDAAALRHQTYWITSGHYENYRGEHVPRCPTHEGEEPLALKPMNCPGHMLLFGSKLRSYRDLPIRYAESSTLHRDERGGTLHGLLRVQAHHAGRRPRLRHARSRSRTRSTGDRLPATTSTTGSESTPRAELSTRPEKQARHATSSGIGPSARSSPRCNGTGSRTRSRRG